MKLYIPEIGDELELTSEWEFCLYPERRNQSLGESMHLRCYRGYDAVKRVYNEGWYDTNLIKDPGSDNALWTQWRENVSKNLIKDFSIKFPVGTILKVDRIYIRKGNENYSSLTFFTKNLTFSDGIFQLKKNKKGKNFRFWAKLDQCNNIEFVQHIVEK